MAQISALSKASSPVMIWKLRHFSFQKQTKLTGGSSMALAAAELSMAAPPETARLCTLGMI